MKSSAKQASQGQVFSAVIAIAVIIGATGFAWFWMQKQESAKNEIETQQAAPEEFAPPPTPTPTPTKLFHGKDTYIVSRGAQATGPNVSEITFDPLDPAVGGQQVISVKASYGSAISDVSVKLRTDTKTTTLKLELAEGTDLGGTWTTMWTVPETYLYNYSATIVATSGKEVTTIPVIIRERK
ncbi:MAG: hypothetical protein ACOY3M_01615 [Patescibacteria group bacterium]